MSYINKEDRQNCWNFRDEYWKCLDEGKPDSECKELRKQYEKFCPSQWVKHFDRKREYNIFKEQIETEGIRSKNEVEYPPKNPVELRTVPHRQLLFARSRNKH